MSKQKLAKLVSAYAVPHTPSFIAEQHGQAPITGAMSLFERIIEHLETSKPDVLVMIQNDHFNSFFLDNWPTFAIGLAPAVDGPSDQTPFMPPYSLPVDCDLARHIQQQCIATDFDISSSQELSVDHSVLVPLHFLTPAMQLPIVPIFVNCLVPPLPSAQRCYNFGKAIGDAVASWPSSKRLAVLASGSLSLEVGGPRIEPGKTFGVPDKDWAVQILEWVKAGAHDAMVCASTPGRMFEAGNVGGEVLNWITLLGAVGPKSPDIVLNQPDLGNAFVAWSFDAA
ncbi:MAG: extradiol ring-cleavage dioxygenase [Bradyrhizobiaceae bacterium]|nr:MAG: extradiol ring-cleavage dioxygenase [Bradyrhizobiaceae bacterium]